MPRNQGPTRRDFVRGLGLAAGAAALGSRPEQLYAAPWSFNGLRPPPPFPDLSATAAPLFVRIVGP